MTTRWRADRHQHRAGKEAAGGPTNYLPQPSATIKKPPSVRRLGKTPPPTAAKKIQGQGRRKHKLKENRERKRNIQHRNKKLIEEGT